MSVVQGVPYFISVTSIVLVYVNSLFRLRFDHPHPPIAEEMPFKPHGCCCDASYYYLVELINEFFIVSRFTIPNKSYPCKSTRAFMVCKLDWEKEEWIMVENIGHNAILLGGNTSTT